MIIALFTAAVMISDFLYSYMLGDTALQQFVFTVLLLQLAWPFGYELVLF